MQKEWLSKEVAPFLQKTDAQNDGSFGETDAAKILRYYGLAVPAILGEAYAGLRGLPLTHEERRGCTWLGATTGLFDDFFEHTNLTDEYIENLYRHPDQFPGINTNERLINYCWKCALKDCTDAGLLTLMAHKVHRAQKDSRLQKGTNPPSFDMLETITYNKGGYSVLFYLSFFYRYIPEDVERLFYHAGALLQLENDLFDVYKDYRDGITTLVTSGKKINEIRSIYHNLWEQLKHLLMQTGFSKKGKKHFLEILCALVSRGFVCLDMLQQLENEHDGAFDPSAFTRKQLICDMEKPLNMLRTMHYYACLL